ncbi:MAG: hypothetical protein IKJ10_03555 [Bacteroidaceae bacterium]|nr:hypothetical protein [Bacteroidaceae bacterium]
MKKLILLFILVMGFVCEGKAQIAPSSEVHFYICTSNTDTPGIVPNFGSSLMFVNNGILFYDYFFYLNEKEINRALSRTKTTQSITPYYPNKSTAKYVAYCQNTASGMAHYYFVSKDKNEMIHVATDFDGKTIISKKYYKRVTKDELLNQIGPNFDFLE